MENIQYPNIKMKIIDKIFGPSMNFLQSKNISPLFIPLIIWTFYVYFHIFRKKSNRKKEEFTILEKISIWGWIITLIFTIASQIIMIIRPWEK